MTEPADAFIDSNIWLYAFIEAQDPSKTRMANQLITTTRPALSTQVINEVCVNLLRKANFNEVDIRKLITSFYQKYPVSDINHNVLLSACDLRRRYQLSYWDSLIAASAVLGKMKKLYSEDMQHGLILAGKLEVVNPFL